MHVNGVASLGYVEIQPVYLRQARGWHAAHTLHDAVNSDLRPRGQNLDQNFFINALH